MLVGVWNQCGRHHLCTLQRLSVAPSAGMFMLELDSETSWIAEFVVAMSICLSAGKTSVCIQPCPSISSTAAVHCSWSLKGTGVEQVSNSSTGVLTASGKSDLSSE